MVSSDRNPQSPVENHVSRVVGRAPTFSPSSVPSRTCHSGSTGPHSGQFAVTQVRTASDVGSALAQRQACEARASASFGRVGGPAGDLPGRGDPALE